MFLFTKDTDFGLKGVFFHKMKETTECQKQTVSFSLPGAVDYRIANPSKYYYDSSLIFLLADLLLWLLDLSDTSLGILSHASCALLQFLVSVASLAHILIELQLGESVKQLSSCFIGINSKSPN